MVVVKEKPGERERTSRIITEEMGTEALVGAGMMIRNAWTSIEETFPHPQGVSRGVSGETGPVR